MESAILFFIAVCGPLQVSPIPFHAPQMYYDMYLAAQIINNNYCPFQESRRPPQRLQGGFGDITNYDNIRHFYYSTDCSMDADDSLHEYRIPEDNA